MNRFTTPVSQRTSMVPLVERPGHGIRMSPNAQIEVYRMDGRRAAHTKLRSQAPARIAFSQDGHYVRSEPTFYGSSGHQQHQDSELSALVIELTTLPRLMRVNVLALAIAAISLSTTSTVQVRDGMNPVIVCSRLKK